MIKTFSNKSIWLHKTKCGFFPLRFFFSLGCFAQFFYRVFGRFVTRGVKKKRLKKNVTSFPQPPKKVLTYVAFFFFHGAPWLINAIYNPYNGAMGASCCWPRSRREYRVAIESKLEAEAALLAVYSSQPQRAFTSRSSVRDYRLSPVAFFSVLHTFSASESALVITRVFLSTAKRRDCPGWSDVTGPGGLLYAPQWRRAHYSH
jgi:hypothetical protein